MDRNGGEAGDQTLFNALSHVARAGLRVSGAAIAAVVAAAQHRRFCPQDLCCPGDNPYTVDLKRTIRRVYASNRWVWADESGQATRRGATSAASVFGGP